MSAATLFPLPAQASSSSSQVAASQAGPASVSGSPASTDDIHDIRGPKAIPSPELWFFWLGGGLALAGLAYAAWRWARHVQNAPKLPYEVALARLERARRLMTLDTAREFSIEASEIVRSYIEARFKVRAAHQTTEEFLHHLLEPSDALLARHRELLGDFLHHCDLAKFARWNLSAEEMEEMYGSARVFISETGKPATPVEPAPHEVAPQNNTVPA
jgi:hypothetical protein